MSRRMDPLAAVSAPPLDRAKPSVSAWSHLAASLAVVMLLGLPVAAGGRLLWNEFDALQRDEQAAADSVVVGYPNIAPAISRASKPDPWFRIEGESILVWAGWTGGREHRWFHARVGDFDRRALGDPVGRDVTQAIDEPAIENGDGPIWRRIPARAPVVGVAIGGCSCAYPMAVLGKVLIVNDVVGGRPYLIHHDPFDRTQRVSTFDARVDGRRITLGSSGLTFRGRHVLYDRGTESLWVDDGDALAAFSGRLKGKRLSVVARTEAVAWRDWRESHPAARLIVGSLERKRPLPSE